MGESTRSLATALVTALQSAPASRSVVAAKALHLIVEARAAIHAGKPASAEHELRSALALVDEIKAMRPSTRITDHIWVAGKHLEYQEPHEVAFDLVSMEVSMADLEDVVSVRRAQQHLEDTRAHLGRGDSDGAGQKLRGVRQKITQTSDPLAERVYHAACFARAAIRFREKYHRTSHCGGRKWRVFSALGTRASNPIHLSPMHD